jgi:adenylate kinase family enzyme
MGLIIKATESMKKIAVFGKPGSGKSALSKKLASVAGIQLHQLDLIVYTKNGDQVERDVYDQAHERILSHDSWIIDGLGPIGSFKKRLAVADTLVYIDLPYWVSYWFVTKRLLKSVFIKPEGWPDGSSVLQGTLQSYKVLKLCPKFWNDEFLMQLEQTSTMKTVYVIRSLAELNSFVDCHVKRKT